MLAESDARIEARSWLKWCEITGQRIEDQPLSPAVKREIELLTAVDLNLVILLDPYCKYCISRNRILRLHPADIHNDPEAPDGLDNSVLWATLYPEEIPSRARSRAYA